MSRSMKSRRRPGVAMRMLHPSLTLAAWWPRFVPPYTTTERSFDPAENRRASSLEATVLFAMFLLPPHFDEIKRNKNTNEKGAIKIKQVHLPKIKMFLSCMKLYTIACLNLNGELSGRRNDDSLRRLRC